MVDMQLPSAKGRSLAFFGSTCTMGLGVIPEAPPWGGVGGMVISQSLLHGTGPSGLSLSRAHCAVCTDGAVLLSLPTPLTLHLAGIQSPPPWSLVLGKRLSVQWYVVPAGFVPLYFREDCLLLLWTEPLPSPP